MFYSSSSQEAVNVVLHVFSNNVDTSIVQEFEVLPNASRVDCIDYADANGVLGLIGERLRGLNIFDASPLWLREVLKTKAREAKKQYASECDNRREVLLALNRAGISCLVLKGAALGHILYTEPEMRPTRDLDLMVSSPDLDATRTILEGLGFLALDGVKTGQHIPRLQRTACRGGSSFAVDLHHRLVPSEIYGIPLLELDSFWENSVIHNGPFGQYMTLGRLDHLLHLHLHLFHHIFYNFRLMHLVDLVTAFCKWTNVDLKLVARELDRIGLAQFRQDLWGWITAFFGVPLGDNHSDRQTLGVGTWLLQHGSLPPFGGLRYARSLRACLNNAAYECRRCFYWWFYAPNGRLMSKRRRPKKNVESQ